VARPLRGRTEPPLWLMYKGPAQRVYVGSVWPVKALGLVELGELGATRAHPRLFHCLSSKPGGTHGRPTLFRAAITAEKLQPAWQTRKVRPSGQSLTESEGLVSSWAGQRTSW
jgi:hypothetical protein